MTEKNKNNIVLGSSKDLGSFGGSTPEPRLRTLLDTQTGEVSVVVDGKTTVVGINRSGEGFALTGEGDLYLKKEGLREEFDIHMNKFRELNGKSPWDAPKTGGFGLDAFSSSDSHK